MQRRRNNEKEQTQRDRDGESRQSTGERRERGSGGARMRHIKGHIVQLEVEVQRHGRKSGVASERAGGREPQVEADVCRPGP